MNTSYLQIQGLINEITDPEQKWISKLGEEISAALKPEVQNATDGLYLPLNQTQINTSPYDPSIARLLRESWARYKEFRGNQGDCDIAYKPQDKPDCQITLRSTSDLLKTGKFRTVVILINGIDLPVQIEFDGINYYAYAKDYEIGDDIERRKMLFEGITGTETDTDMIHRWQAQRLSQIQLLSQIATHPDYIADVFKGDQLARVRTNRLLTAADIHTWQNTCMRTAGYKPVKMPYYGEYEVVVTEQMKFFYISTANYGTVLTMDYSEDRIFGGFHVRQFPVEIYRMSDETIEKQNIIAFVELGKDSKTIEMVHYTSSDLALYSLNLGTRTNI